VNIALTKLEALHAVSLGMRRAPEILKIAIYKDSKVPSYEHSGYSLLKAFADFGVKVRFEFTGPADFVYGPMSWIHKNHSVDGGLIGPDTVVFTMHETTRWAQSWIKCLNQAQSVIFPSMWNAMCATASGLERVVHICPLGYDDSMVRGLPYTSNGKFIFGTVANYYTGAERKGLQELLHAYERLEGDEHQLWIRCPDVADRPATKDSRVVWCEDKLSRENYLHWCQQIHVGVFANKSEGFGMPQLEFAAQAKPVIHCHYGSVSEFLPRFHELDISGTLAQCSGKYEGQGIWFQPDVTSILKAMRFCLANKAAMLPLGLIFRNHVKYLSWSNAQQTLMSILAVEKKLEL
jgi:hypothetical protein